MDGEGKGHQHQQSAKRHQECFCGPDPTSVGWLRHQGCKCSETEFLAEGGEAQQDRAKSEGQKNDLFKRISVGRTRHDQGRHDRQEHGNAPEGKQQPDFFANERVHLPDCVRVFEATKISSSESDSQRRSSGCSNWSSAISFSLVPLTRISTLRPFCFICNAPLNTRCAGAAVKRTEIFLKRSRASSAFIVSRLRPCSMTVNSSIKPSNSEIKCVETNTVRFAGSLD